LGRGFKMDNNVLILIEQMKIIGSLMIIGVFEQRIKLFGKNLIDALSQIISKLILPIQLMTVIGSISRSDLISSGRFFLCTIIMYPLCIFLAGMVTKFLRLKEPQKSMHVLVTSFGNGGFIGLPLIISMFPKTAGKAAAAFMFIEAVVYWVFGPILASPEKKKKIDFKMVISPLTISIAIGIIIVLLNINLTGLVFWDTLTDVGNTSKYFASIYIGMNIGMMGLKRLKNNLKVLFAAPFKLIIFPVIAFILFGKTGILTGDLLVMFVVLFSTPSGMALPIVAQISGSDSEYASSGTIATTILCLFTMPFVIWLTTVI
jgi:predicted permease